MPFEKGREGRGAIDELAQAWLTAVSWVHRMDPAERRELAERTRMMAVIAEACASKRGAR